MKTSHFLSILFLICSALTIEAQIPNFDISSLPSGKFITDPYGKGDYLNPAFTRHINQKKINYILEIGSRDAIDAIELSQYYRCHVFAFECNPEAIDICKANINDYKNVTLVEKAAWDKTGAISFHPVVQGGAVFSRGSSSIFEFDPNGPVKGSQRQSCINVDSVRLDDWLYQNKLPTPTLICMDTQGATLQVLKGLGKRIREVKYILTEADLQAYYIGEELYPQIMNFLKENNFCEAVFLPHGPYADILYVNTRFK